MSNLTEYAAVTCYF